MLRVNGSDTIKLLFETVLVRMNFVNQHECVMSLMSESRHIQMGHDTT